MHKVVRHFKHAPPTLFVGRLKSVLRGLSVFNWVKNFSIAVRVYLLAGIAVFGVAALYGTYWFSHETIEENRQTSEHFNKAGMLVSELESEMLALRQHEKDFLLRRDDRYVTFYETSSQNAEALLDELNGMIDDPRVVRAEGALLDILRQHRSQFAKVVTAQKALGLTESDGFQGSLRGAVHDIEELLKAPENDRDSLWRLMLMMRRHEKDFIMRVDPKYVDRIDARQMEFDLALTDSNIPTDSKAAMTERLTFYVEAFKQYAETRLSFAGNVDRLTVIYSDVPPYLERLTQIAKERREAAIAIASETDADGYSQITLISVIVGILALLISRIVISTTIRPVKNLEQSLMHVADGDYETVIPGTEFNDEIGTMAKVAEKLKVSAAERLELEMKALQEVTRKADAEREETAKAAKEAERKAEERAERAKMREARAQRLDTIIAHFDQSIASAISNLSAASGAMKDTSGIMVNVAEATGTQSAVVKDASGDMEQNATTMLAAIEEFSASIREVNMQVQNAGTISKEAVQASQDSSTSISHLSENSREIEDVVKLINDIAEQTNLLALNATIEAARAGDAGRGFAVVASEVKSLANQTAKATDEITDQIKGMQDMTKSAVQANASIGETIDRLNEIMVSITAAVEEQYATTGEINRSVQYTSEGTQRVSSEIQKVADGADQTGTQSANVAAAAEELDQLSTGIRTEVEQFLADVRAIQSEMDENEPAPEPLLRAVS